jgi:hyperosmotically inducible protein
MNGKGSHRRLLLAPAVIVAGALAISGCQHHPDEAAAVYSTLTQHDLRSVVVSQDRDSGVITLAGIVGSPDRKARAELLAKQAAPGYTVTNNITVTSAGLETMEKSAARNAALDNSIEDQFKATIKKNKHLAHQSIEYQAANGTLYLKGTVKSEEDRKEAEELAKKVPQVQHVVNDIAVKTGKHTPTNS